MHLVSLKFLRVVALAGYLSAMWLASGAHFHPGHHDHATATVASQANESSHDHSASSDEHCHEHHHHHHANSSVQDSHDHSCDSPSKHQDHQHDCPVCEWLALSATSPQLTSLVDAGQALVTTRIEISAQPSSIALLLPPTRGPPTA
ncbi:DUF2946 family protein [Calycomorphotria hydatis]|uniref:DUF2946 family protein n=1 Tax=Calycomorphotria hydatis TaxID=2528027 RepID=UPI0011A78D08|nr:DUF2946 family protein [Calycomorphotria hydatis]